MRSHIRKYEMFKAGEYIPESHQVYIDLYKKLENMPDDYRRKEILMQLDRIIDRQEKYLTVMAIALLILGGIFGFIFGYGMAVVEYIGSLI